MTLKNVQDFKFPLEYNLEENKKILNYRLHLCQFILTENHLKQFIELEINETHEIELRNILNHLIVLDRFKLFISSIYKVKNIDEFHNFFVYYFLIEEMLIDEEFEIIEYNNRTPMKNIFSKLNKWGIKI